MDTTNRIIKEQKDIQDPTWWAWVAGGTNEAIQRMEEFCLVEWTDKDCPVPYHCSLPRHHDGPHSGYALIENNGGEWIERHANTSDHAESDPV